MVWSTFSSFSALTEVPLINISSIQNYLEKFLGTPRIELGGCWVRSANATSMLCRPPWFLSSNLLPGRLWEALDPLQGRQGRRRRVGGQVRRWVEAGGLDQEPAGQRPRPRHEVQGQARGHRGQAQEALRLRWQDAHHSVRAQLPGEACLKLKPSFAFYTVPSITLEQTSHVNCYEPFPPN